MRRVQRPPTLAAIGKRKRPPTPATGGKKRLPTLAARGKGKPFSEAEKLRRIPAQIRRSLASAGL